MKITEKQIKAYLQATNGKKSYLRQDYEKCKDKLTIEEFIYISDCFERVIKLQIKKEEEGL